MHVVCLDLEGVLVPEIWIRFAEKTGIDELRRTTRDEPDYDRLMRYRLDILDRHGYRLPDIEAVIASMAPLEGASNFLDGLRQQYQVIILSDTFYEFAMPLMRQLNSPTLFCHRLQCDEAGRIVSYKLRMANHKKHAVDGLRTLKFMTIAAGDSYNDTAMLSAADHGLLFCPPQNVIDDFPQFRVTTDYDTLRHAIDDFAAGAELLPNLSSDLASVG